ncbi:MAG: hypothetical protein HY348_07805 [Nitrospira defluvii]|nr:hypothetical protein [Nitrospira defluvii]
MLLWCAPWSWAGTIMVDLGVEQGLMNHRANGYLVSIEPTPTVHGPDPAIETNQLSRECRLYLPQL